MSWMRGGIVAGALPDTLLARESLGCADSVVALGKPSETGPGRKFGPNGEMQKFPGNTILCHLNQPGKQFDALKQAAAVLRAKVGDANIAWLPASSYHMTIFDGSLDSRRQPGDWPHLLPLDASMQECNEFIAEMLKKFDLGFEPPIRMVPDEDLLTETRAWIPLRPIDEAEARRLKDLRDRLSMAIGVRHSNHDSYEFHATFGYYINQFSREAELDFQAELIKEIKALRKLSPVIELGAPEYCLFEDMAAYQIQFHLSRRR